MKLSIETPGLPQFEIELEWCERTDLVIYPDIVKCAAFAMDYNGMQDLVYHDVNFCTYCGGWHTEHPHQRFKDSTEMWDIEVRDY